jgi:hydrogenase maturation factor HypF (carbamoyltransferase family)
LFAAETTQFLIGKTGCILTHEEVDLAKCPKCGKEVAKPERVLTNKFFQIEAYACAECGTRFKVTN